MFSEKPFNAAWCHISKMQSGKRERQSEKDASSAGSPPNGWQSQGWPRSPAGRAGHQAPALSCATFPGAAAAPDT